MARILGAQVCTIVAAEFVDRILEFARANAVCGIPIGAPAQTGWQQLFGGSVPLRLVRRGSGFDLHIPSAPEGW